MRLTQLLRLCSTGSSATSKQLLMQLRQSTGYPMLACRQAIARFQGDAAAAKAWLDERAQAEGWAKAEKLVDRSARQGLIGVVRRGEHRLALLELRCETDFVARNARFQSLLSDACRSLANAAEGPSLSKLLTAPSTAGGSSSLLALVPRDNLLALPVANATTSLADAIASLVGSVGENVLCGRAFVLNSAPHSLAVYCHSPWQGENAASSSSLGDCQFGRYAAAVAYTGGNELLAYQLCQHVVGRNPARIGTEEEGQGSDPPAPNPDKEAETTLVHQEFLADETRLVGEVLDTAGMRVTGYFRIKCAEE